MMRLHYLSRLLLAVLRIFVRFLFWFAKEMKDVLLDPKLVEP